MVLVAKQSLVSIYIHQGNNHDHRPVSSSSSYLFIYQVTSYHKKKTATSSRSITKASKYAIPLKPTHKLAELKQYLVTW